MNYIERKNSRGSAFISLMTLAGFTFGATAQESDSTLMREMVIEKEYSPVVKDADKIVRMPEVEAPRANKTSIVYSDPGLNINTESKINNLTSGDIGTNYMFSKERGYLNLGYGVYNNILFENGYKFVDTDENKLGIILNLNSFSGNVKSNHSSEKSRMRNTNSLVNLFYNHKAEKIAVSTNIKFGWDPFSYYGFVPHNEEALDFDGLPVGSINYDNSEKTRRYGQRVDRYGADFKVESRNTEFWQYQAFASFMRMGFKRPDFNENTAHFGGKLSRLMGDNWRITGDVDLKYLFYGGDKYLNFPHFDRVSKELKNCGLSSFKAYFDYVDKDNISFKGGLVVDVATGLAPHFSVAPYVDFNWKISELFGVYSSITGGMKQYSYDEELRNNRYFLGEQTKNSYTPFDFKVGMRTSPLSGLQFDIFGGIDYTCNQRFYMSDLRGLYYGELSEDIKNYELNLLSAYTNNAFKYSVGGKVKYTYGKLIDAALSVQGNGYSLKDDNIASYMPKCEINFNLGVRPIERLLINLEYDFKSRHDGLVSTQINTMPQYPLYMPANIIRYSNRESMSNINMLNLKGAYSFTNSFGVFAHLNNLLNYKDDMWYGMSTMGMNFVAGVNFKL